MSKWPPAIGAEARIPFRVIGSIDRPHRMVLVEHDIIGRAYLYRSEVEPYLTAPGNGDDPSPDKGDPASPPASPT